MPQLEVWNLLIQLTSSNFTDDFCDITGTSDLEIPVAIRRNSTEFIILPVQSLIKDGELV